MFLYHELNEALLLQNRVFFFLKLVDNFVVNYCIIFNYRDWIGKPKHRLRLKTTFCPLSNTNI